MVVIEALDTPRRRDDPAPDSALDRELPRDQRAAGGVPQTSGGLR
ncbi:hypothetical protein [Gandjariella thermophila]|uniref:Uncharacterized protein n=1 Tax=Gandjariella thermophila TaxID=1931992 RepID=A0A4D4J5T3_9PSEU|nr:hypothetical protein [Gandjariella thermophila]GDY32065.1 hypothetical protein GTS_36980 [Gandjariella thermophila]